MVLASHYIFKDALHLLEGEKYRRLEEICTSYQGRYSEDEELLEIFDLLLNHMHSDGKLDIDELKERLKRMTASRRLYLGE